MTNTSDILFCHLHVHSEYSLVDGCISIKQLMSETKLRNHTHVAITDHANMHGAIDFYLSAKKNGLTPIIGCEIYHNGISSHYDAKKKLPFNLVLLAKNLEGYKNLIKIVSSAYIDKCLQEVPIVSEKVIDKYSKGLVCLSAGSKGELGFLVDAYYDSKKSNKNSQNILNALEHHIEVMKKRFPQGDYYVELNNNGLRKQIELIPQMASCAKKYSLPLVATGNVHYINPDFAHSHSIAVAIKNGLTMNDLKSQLSSTSFHLATDEQIFKTFAAYPEAIANTMEIARCCSHLEIPMGEYYLPKISHASESSSDSLCRLAKEGLEKRFVFMRDNYQNFADKIDTYEKRLEYELKVIIKMGFSDYFLIVQDFIAWAKDNDIPVGPGRGSGAGSLVAYALEITDIDPLPYQLIFERFLNPERVSMPDFDIDFCQWRREEVIEYCIKKYGSKNVAQITTFGKLMAKGAVKSVGRAMNLSFNRVDRFTKLFPPDLGITIKDALNKEERLREEMEKDEALKECVEYALNLEGLVSHTSVHAAGVVISDGPMTDYLPIYTTDGKNYITQYEMKPTEKVGLVKFDFLRLKTLTIIDKSVKQIRSNKKELEDFSIHQIPLDDKRVYEMLSHGHTCGIFQCESQGMTQLIKKLKPNCFEDIIALVALFRPGPLGSGMVDDFVERKHGRQSIRYLHPLLEDILKDTYGMILYQEQVQKIAAILANYSLGEADLLRRAMGKKIAEEMLQQKSRFLEGAETNKIDLRLAESIFDLMAEFAKYGFNKSHSAAYGLITYQTAYLKFHFPEQFLAACMTCDMDNMDKIKAYAQECRRFGIDINKPDINYSTTEFYVPKALNIRFALSAIKGVGESMLKPLFEARQTAKFTSLDDLIKRINLARLGKKNLELLILSGALDWLNTSRRELIKKIPEIVNLSDSHHENSQRGQFSLFSDEVFEEDKDKQPVQAHDSKSVYLNSLLEEEKRLTGIFLSAHPTKLFQSDIKNFGMTIKTIKNLVQEKITAGKKNKKSFIFVAYFAVSNQRRTKKGSIITFIRLEQGFDYIEGVIFEKDYDKMILPPHGSLVYASGEVESSFNNTPRFTIKTIVPVEQVRVEKVKHVDIKIDHKIGQDFSNIRCLKNIFLQNKGPTTVRFVLISDKAKTAIRLSDTYRVRLTNEFIEQIQAQVFGYTAMAYRLN